jgi:hypothetical protein
MTTEYEIQLLRLAPIRPPEPVPLWRRVADRIFNMRALVVVVVAAVALYAANLFWPVLTQKVFVRQDKAPTSNSEAPIVGDPRMPLAERSVLGTTSSLSAQPLRLFLLATQPGAAPTEGTAQLGTDPRNPQTLAAGAVLANGTRIAEIHADHVVLERDDQRVILNIDQPGAIEAGGPQVVRAGGLGMSSESALRRELAAVQALPVPSAPMRPMPAGSIREINEVVRAQPVYRDSTLTGFAVMAGSQGGLFSRIGLQSGDVVVSVEGAVIQKPSQWSAVSDALLAGQRVNVTVERQGQTMAMALDGEQLLATSAPPALPPGMLPGPPAPRGSP